jgi:hypothetical protein
MNNPDTPQAAWERVDKHMRELYGISLRDMVIDSTPGRWRHERTGAAFVYFDKPNALLGHRGLTRSWEILMESNRKQEER